MDIGIRIKEECLAKGMSFHEFAEKMNMVHSNVYDVFRRKTTDASIVYKASIVLHHNFFEDLAKEMEEELGKTKEHGI